MNEPAHKPGDEIEKVTAPEAGAARTTTDFAPAAQHAKPKPPASVLSADLTVKGNIKTSGDVQVDGTVEGDIRAHLLTVGEGATIKGEVMADDVVVNGRIVGRVRGLKVRLTSTARVEGDIIHKTIAIESGAHFEGSVQRNENPLNNKPAAAETARTHAQQVNGAEPHSAARGTSQGSASTHSPGQQTAAAKG